MMHIFIRKPHRTANELTRSLYRPRTTFAQQEAYMPKYVRRTQQRLTKLQCAIERDAHIKLSLAEEQLILLCYAVNPDWLSGAVIDYAEQLLAEREIHGAELLHRHTTHGGVQ